MPRVSVDIDPALDHAVSIWTQEECYRFYVRQRRLYCSYMELLDLWLQAPVCVDCIQSDPFECLRLPDIGPEAWEEDILITVGETTLTQTQVLLLKNPDFAFECKKCGRSLRPWNGDEVYVVDNHVEGYYGLPMETPGKRQPSGRLRRRIIKLYGNECFKCGLSGRETKLHIDHIRPQALGGDAAFRNLQPLCEKCGGEKGNAEPSERAVYNTIYFGPQPSDGYEGLFW
ncbi:MAG TPA: HNH endonuclease [Verrucomicrobiae bacterium]|nr:HNH endonuclease [Verrucomicrobiae bacterium]